MSGIAGFVGDADPKLLDAMLAAIDYRGDRTETATATGVGLGYRWWGGRPGKSPGIHRAGANLTVCAGTLAPPTPSPAAALAELLNAGASLTDLDGAFACASWDDERRRLTLIRDPFGVRSLYYVEHGGVFYFASELKQLLAIPGLPIEPDYHALHKYLTFSFVPGEDVPIKGIRRLLPGHVAHWSLPSPPGGEGPGVRGGQLHKTDYFTLKEQVDPRFENPREAVRFIRERCTQAVAKRLNGEPEVGLYLSGGVDSSGVAVWLQEAGVKVHAFTLDFGARSVEKQQAQQVAEHLRIPLTLLPVSGADIAPMLMDLVWKLDLPFGDAVTGPQYLLGRAARQAGLTAVWNGEGGDQFFGGWTSKPMISAQLYADLYEDTSREEIYLRSYHRFYGLEDQLYTPEFRALVGPPGQRRALLAPHLHSSDAATFLNRVRLADIELKGSQNILPRLERMANAWALDARVPLFDRALAEASFQLPPRMKLHGACEKYVLKLILQKKLPREIVWRRKFGMSVPITDWVLGPLAPTMETLLGPAALARRGLFRADYVSRLRQGQNEPHETRRRRVGERLWALAMLEAWLQIFIDGKGRQAWRWRVKCIKCDKDVTYKERKDSGTCPHCHGTFTFDPRKGDPFTDVLFKNAIDVVSANGTVRFGADHVYYEICRRVAKKRTPTFAVGCLVVFGSILAAAFIPSPERWIVIAFLLALGVGVGLIFRPGPVAPMSRHDFEGYWLRWCSIHPGAPKGMIVRKLTPSTAKAIESDLGDYSFDRAVICDTEATVDLLLANQFHFENNCAVLSIDGYPPGPFAVVRKMLQRNPNLQVFVLHDATRKGCQLAHKLANDPEWFKGRAKVIDVGLRPLHAAKFKGLWRALKKDVQPGDGISAEEAKWLSAYELSLTVVRPEQVLKRLFRAINRQFDPNAIVTAHTASDGGTSGTGIADDSFAEESTDSDGGADAFG